VDPFQSFQTKTLGNGGRGDFSFAAHGIVVRSATLAGRVIV